MLRQKKLVELGLNKFIYTWIAVPSIFCAPPPCLGRPLGLKQAADCRLGVCRCLAMAEDLGQAPLQCP